jgi:serine/threonine protein kinase
MPALPGPSPGDVLGGYRLLEITGRGGLGTVFKAADERGRLWAIKVVNASANPTGAERLRQEAATARLVDHPNVVRVVAAGEELPYAYLVMEFVWGVSLSSCLADGQRLPVHEVVGIGVQVLRALEALHARDIVHRDVKPGNLLVSRADDGPRAGGSRQPLLVKLADFGIALSLLGTKEDSAEQERGVLGTPTYMAPEQWQRPDTVDGRADVYALGCTLFQLLCGRPPFEGPEAAQVALQHLQAPRPDPGSVRGDVGPELAAVIRRMLAVNPDERYPSAAAARAALEEALRNSATVADEGEALRLPGEPREPASFSAEVGAAGSADSEPKPGVSDRSPATGERPAAPAVAPTVATEDVAPAAPRTSAARGLGHYELQQELWRDFASTIYRARDTVLDVEVAVEVLQEHPAGPDLVERFRRRARAGALVNHPNVHRVFALHQVDQDSFGIHEPRGRALAFCVLEPLRGQTLQARLDGPLPLAEALTITEQVLLALHAIHAHGLVHRDIKPASIFLQGLLPVGPGDKERNPGREQPAWSWPWIVKLTGFLIVRDIEAREALTHHGTGMGTAAYMAPEQAVASDQSDARADLYALGCVLFEMVCGRPPFTGASPIHVLAAHQSQEPPDPATLRPDMPAALRQLIRRLLAKRPEDRYPSAASTLEALEEARAALRRPHQGETRREDRTTAADAPAATKRLDRLLRLDDRAFSAELVVTHYPAPVALAYRRFCRQAEPRARLERLFYAVEACLRYLVTLGLSDLLQCLAADAQDTLTLPAHEAFDFLRRPVPMQLGMWLSGLRETARALARQPERFVPELSELCEPGGRLERDVLGQLIAYRNEATHAGGIPVTADECQALCRAARPLLEEFLGAVRFVCAYPLGFVQRGLALGRQAQDRHGYYLHSCMGAGVENTAGAYHVETPSPLVEQVPFVVAGDGSRLLYLWPFLAQRVSPVSERHTLYAFEDLPDRNRPFLTYLRAAALDVREEWRQLLHERPTGDHSWMLDQFRVLRAASAVPAGLEVHVRLMPWRGGALTGLKVDGLELLAPVGRGGFGTIYAAATPTGQRVAVKVLESASASLRQLQRFRAEFARLKSMGEKLAGMANPPGIIRCFESNAALLDGRVYPWYSMEFALGGDLGGRIEDRRGGRLGQAAWSDPECRCQIVEEFRQVLAAVAYLHEEHVIHRDLKPSNVLILEDGRLCLSDFGLAKHLGSSEGSAARGPATSSGAVLGTRCYMAPEQEKGQDVAEPADVYALGILLAELAVGDRPPANTGVSQGSTLQGWRRLKQLPDGWRRFALRLTDVVPGRRPANGRAVLQEFQALLARET